MPDLFENARDFRVETLNVDNINGDDIAERCTNIDDEEVGREVYDQDGAVCVVNGEGKFTGTINHGGDSYVYRERNAGRPVQPPHSDSQHSSAHQEPHQAKCAFDRSHSSLPQAQERPPRNVEPTGRCTAGSAASFRNAELFGISSMEIKNVGKNRIDKDSTNIQRKYVRERVYNQKGAIGVVNGRGTFSGTINIGAMSSERQPVPHSVRESDTVSQPNNSKSPMRDIESEEDEIFLGDGKSSANSDRVAARYVLDQSHSIGVANDRSTFTGNINVSYGRNEQTKPVKMQHGSGYIVNRGYGPDPGAHYGLGHTTEKRPRPQSSVRFTSPANAWTPPFQVGPDNCTDRNPFRRMADSASDYPSSFVPGANGLNKSLQSGNRSSTGERHQYSSRF